MYMGIKNLFKLIKQKAPDAISSNTIDFYSNKIIGIDANLMIYKIIFGIRSSGKDIMKNGKVITHIHGILQKIKGFQKHLTRPIFVFDGEFPEFKQAEILRRSTSKINVKESEYSDIIKIIRIFGYQVIMSKGEADNQLAYLAKNRMIDYVATDDMDLLLFGKNIKILKNFSVNLKKNIIEINSNLVLKNLDIDRSQMIDIGILSGCDYCGSAKGIGPIKGYNLIRKYGSLQKLIKMNLIQIKMSEEEIKIIQKYFKNKKKLLDIKYKKNPIKTKELEKFMKSYGI